MSEFKELIEIGRPAFEKRHDDPSKDYGIGCVMMEFVLVGPGGAVQFEVFTGWYLPHVAERLRKESSHRRYGDVPDLVPGVKDDGGVPTTDRGRWMRCALEGQGGAVFFHSTEPQYEGHEVTAEAGDCKFMPDGAACYQDVGFSAGDAAFDALVKGGQEGVFKHLRELYDLHLAVVA